MRTKKVEDPDFGPIELPDEPPVPAAEWKARDKLVVQAARGLRAWKPGKVYRCPTCDKRTFVGANDVSVEFIRGPTLVVFRHLHGARCASCNAQALEAYEQVDLERERGTEFHPDYEAKVSRIGRGTLGTYWPKDVERVLGLTPDKKVFIQVVSRDGAFLQIRDPVRPRRASPKQP